MFLFRSTKSKSKWESFISTNSLFMKEVAFWLSVFFIQFWNHLSWRAKISFIFRYMGKFEVLRTVIYFGNGFDALFRCLHIQREKRTCASLLNVVITSALIALHFLMRYTVDVERSRNGCCNSRDVEIDHLSDFRKKLVCPTIRRRCDVVIVSTKTSIFGLCLGIVPGSVQIVIYGFSTFLIRDHIDSSRHLHFSLLSSSQRFGDFFSRPARFPPSSWQQ